MSGIERRQYERTPFSTGVTIVDQATQRQYEGHSIDLSVGGMSFYSERFFDKGSSIALIARIGQSQGSEVTSIPATVQWARVEGDGAIMGVEFCQPLSRSAHPELYERLCSV